MVLVVKDTVIPEDLVKDAVIKALKTRIEDIDQKSENLKGSIEYFEIKYGMETEDFYKKFNNGELADEMDFFEWKASWEIFNELKREKKALLEAIG